MWRFISPDYESQLSSQILQNLSLQPVSPMTMETLEFVIYPDGRVQETVTGIVGSSCTKVTAEIEAVLGRVVAHQPTAEFFEQENTQAVTDTNTNFTTW